MNRNVAPRGLNLVSIMYETVKAVAAVISVSYPVPWVVVLLLFCRNSVTTSVVMTGRNATTESSGQAATP